jgi:hypothetical protein
MCVYVCVCNMNMEYSVWSMEKIEDMRYMRYMRYRGIGSMKYINVYKCI